jgi:hypothetical protein
MRERPERGRIVIVVIGMILVAGAVLGFRAVSRSRGPETVIGMPSSERIEQEYGIRIERVSLIASGGLVELKYLVLDADAAGAIHDDDAEDFPSIVADGTVIGNPTFQHHGGKVVVVGRELSILYTNAKGAVRTGETVSIEIGDEQLSQVPVS